MDASLTLSPSHSLSISALQTLINCFLYQNIEVIQHKTYCRYLLALINFGCIIVTRQKKFETSQNYLNDKKKKQAEVKM